MKCACEDIMIPYHLITCILYHFIMFPLQHESVASCHHIYNSIHKGLNLGEQMDLVFYCRNITDTYAFGLLFPKQINLKVFPTLTFVSIALLLLFWVREPSVHHHNEKRKANLLQNNPPFLQQ